MAEDVEHPPQPRGDPAADVVVGHHEARVPDPGSGEALGEGRRRGEGMAARRPEPGRVGQVLVEVEMDRPRQVPRRVGRRARPRAAEHPAAVHDPEVGLAAANELEEVGGGDERGGTLHAPEDTDRPFTGAGGMPPDR